MILKYIVILCLWLYVGGDLTGSPQTSRFPGGLRYVTNYFPLADQAQPQNWCAVQDKSGIIYIGNHGGLLEYDGAYWRAINLPSPTVRSLTVDDNNTVFVGGNNVFGYLAPGPDGNPQFISLFEKLDNKIKRIGTIWKTFATPEGVYFQSLNYLLRWDSNARSLKVWQPKTKFSAALYCGGELFIRQKDIGLMKIVSETPVPVPNGDFLRSSLFF
jgi:hypothetical protein